MTALEVSAMEPEPLSMTSSGAVSLGGDHDTG